jgi:Flp pilus assembly protein TadB
MLSEREQRTLDEIEMRLIIEDPRFCARMGRNRSRVRFRVVFAYLGILTIMTAASASFASGLPVVGVALIASALAVVAGYLLASWQRRRRARRFGCGAF